MLIYLSLVLALFCFFVAIFPLKINRWWKLIIFLILSAISQKYLVMYLFGGKAFFAPALPRDFMLFTAWLYAVLICWFGTLLVSVIVRCGIHLYRKYKQKEKPANWDKWVCRTNFILLGISIFCTLLGLHCGTSLPAVKERTVYLKDLPQEADGMKIALLSDLHIDYISKPEHLKMIVQMVNDAKPDLIVITGDYVDGSVERC